jgi:hypothetical protein
MTPPKMRFEVHRYADISFSYLRESDIKIINEGLNFPFLIVQDKECCAFFYVPMNGTLLENIQEIISEFRKVGVSQEMTAIFIELRKRKIQYVRFDIDGGEVENAKHQET